MDTKPTIPSEREIKEMEIRIAEMKRIRENAKREVLGIIKDESLLDSLSASDALTIITRLQHKIKCNHVNRRGSPVSPELKANLISALKMGEMTLSEAHKMFNLSISYISRVKRELKDSGEIEGYGRVQNAYTDNQMTLQQKEAVA
jgi:hypothetical protein